MIIDPAKRKISNLEIFSENNLISPNSLIGSGQFIGDIESIKELVFSQLGFNYIKSKITEKEIFEKYPVELSYNFDSMLKIEKLITSSLFLKKFEAIEFPINIRTAHSVVSQSYLSGKYPTDNIHIDTFGKEPIDIFNCIIYLFGDFDTLCRFKNVSDKQYQELISSPYFKNQILINNLIEASDLVLGDVKEGDFIMFDSYLPHYTIRSKKINRGRISLDWRFKYNDPYLESDDDMDNKSQIRLQKYWYLCKEKMNNMSERFEYELSKIESIHGHSTAFKKRESEYFKYKEKICKNDK